MSFSKPGKGARQKVKKMKSEMDSVKRREIFAL